jgi:membrane-associated protease RseP (regulator of RpoE activity)
MSHLRSIVALVMLAGAAHYAHAQQPSPQRMTLSFRTPSWFGLAVDCAACLTSTATSGARPLPVVTQITAGGPADRASLQVGDTIIAVDGREVLAADLPKTLSSAPPGTTTKLTVGTRRGRSTVSMTSEKAQIQFFKGDSLPIRYRGEYAQVTVDVMTMDAPVVTRDSTGAMLIHVGQHVIRLQRVP